MSENVFEQKSHLKMYLSLAMPVVIGLVITIVYNIADTYFVARTQNSMLVAGVSLCAPVFTILMAFGNIYGQGGSSLIARLYGQKNTQEAQSVSAYCFYISLLTGIVIGALMLIFCGPLLNVLGADAQTVQYAKPYYQMMAVGAPFVVANFIYSNLLRAEGMAKESMVGNITGLLVNIILDPILISTLHMGAFGAALASVIGYFVTNCYHLSIVLRKSRILSADIRQIRISGYYQSQIFGVGISAAVTNWMSSICLIITNHYLLRYGNDSIAAMGLCMKVSMIVLLVATGMVFGSAPMVGYFYGGKRFKELKGILRMVLSLVEGVTIVISIVVLLAAKPAIGIFLKDETIIKMGAQMLRFQVITMFLAVFVMLATVCFQASGLAKEALVVSVLRQGIIFLIVITITANVFGYTGILLAQAITDVLTALLVGVIFSRSFYGKLQ